MASNVFLSGNRDDVSTRSENSTNPCATFNLRRLGSEPLSNISHNLNPNGYKARVLAAFTQGPCKIGNEVPADDESIKFERDKSGIRFRTPCSVYHSRMSLFTLMHQDPWAHGDHDDNDDEDPWGMPTFTTTTTSKDLGPRTGERRRQRRLMTTSMTENLGPRTKERRRLANTTMATTTTTRCHH